MTRIGVLGAGSWGTTLANLLARNGHEVQLWAYEAEVVESINARHVNDLFMKGSALHPDLAATSHMSEAAAYADIILCAAPSHVARRVLAEAGPHMVEGCVLVSATKGIEQGSLALMSEVVAAEVPSARFAALSGPSFAQEVMQGQPTAVVAAATAPAVASQVQQMFAGPRFRVYTNDDVPGVELAGALKNVIAVAAGLLEGMGLGHNPRSALITRGLAEIARLGRAMGARPETFAGLAGMGDLILTTTGSLSRNRALGVALARGESLDQYRARHRTVAEGANTAVAAAALAIREGVEMPITQQVCSILDGRTTPVEAMTALLERDLKAEQWT